MRDLRFHAQYAICQDREIGAVAGAFHQVRGVGLASVKMGGDRGGQMSAGGKTPNADVVWFHAIIGGMGTYITHGPLAILNRRRVVVTGRNPVMQDKSGNAAIIQPLGNLRSFMVKRQKLITS